MTVTDNSNTERSTRCWKCHKPIDDMDHYCRYCGVGQGNYIPWKYKPWGIALIAVAAGPLALPALWRTPQLTRQTKIFSTLIILAIFIYMIEGSIKIFQNIVSYYTAIPNIN